MTNTATAAPMIHVRLDRRRHISSEPQNLCQPGGHLVDAIRRLCVIECHGLEGVDRRNVLRTRHAGVQRNLHRLGLRKLLLDLRRQQVVDELLSLLGDAVLRRSARPCWA